MFRVMGIADNLQTGACSRRAATHPARRAFRAPWVSCGCLRAGIRAVVSGIALATLPHSPAMAEVVLFQPNGPVAAEMEWLFWVALGLMAIVVVPVLVLTPLFAWRYRARRKGEYRPEWDFNFRLDLAIWIVPALIVVALGYLVWTRTHALDPYDKVGTGDTLEIQAIALDWKWLFIYPEQDIAVVNEMAVPEDRPFRVALTADTVMNAFFIPGLGGQIFAMAGMRTEMNLLADEPATMWGRNMQFTGKEFPEQIFTVRVTDAAGFERWVERTRERGEPLDRIAYEALEGDHSTAPVIHYAPVLAEGLFDEVIASYRGGN